MSKKNYYKTTTTTELDYMRVIKITIGVLITLALVYFGTAIMSGELKLKKEKKEEKVTTVSYSNILAGETFNRSPIDYYVFFYKSSDTFNAYYTQLVELYNKKLEKITRIVDNKHINFNPILASNIVIKGEKHIEVKVIIELKKYPSFISTEGESLYFK